MNPKSFIQIEHKNSFNGKFQDIWSLASLDDDKIITGSCSGTLSVYSIDLSKKTYSIIDTKEKAHNSAAVNYILVYDNNLIVSCGDDGSILMWTFENNKQLTASQSIISHHSQNVKKIILLKDNKTFATCSFDRTIKLWEKQSPHNLIYSLQECNRVHSIIQIKNSKDANNVLVESWGSNCGFITVWDLVLYKRKGTIRNVYTFNPNGLIELNNGNVAVSRYEPPSIVIVDIFKYEIVKTISNDDKMNVIRGQSSLTVTNDGSLIYVYEGGYVQIKMSDYSIMKYGTKMSNFLGWGGLVFLNKEKYIITNNTSNGIGIFSY